MSVDKSRGDEDIVAELFLDMSGPSGYSGDGEQWDGVFTRNAEHREENSCVAIAIYVDAAFTVGKHSFDKLVENVEPPAVRSRAHEVLGGCAK